MSTGIEGRVIAITGGGSGMGRALALDLAGRGRAVAVCGRRPEPIEETVALIGAAGGEAWPTRRTSATPRRSMRSSTPSASASAPPTPSSTTPPATSCARPSTCRRTAGWPSSTSSSTARSSARAPSRAASRDAERSTGSILSVVATYAWTGNPGTAHSAAAKAGVLNLTKTLAVEWAPLGLRVNCMAPGVTDTEGAASNLFPTEEARDQMTAEIPLGRFAELDDIVRCARFLLSDDASYVTGECLTLDGGRVLEKGLFRFSPPLRVVDRPATFTVLRVRRARAWRRIGRSHAVPACHAPSSLPCTHPTRRNPALVYGRTTSLRASLLERAVVRALPLAPPPLVRRVAARYVAGEDLDDAVRVARELAAGGMRATIDLLGEGVDDDQRADAATDEYVRALDALRAAGLPAGVSVKLSALGLARSEEAAATRLRRIVEAGAASDRFVRIDMEEASTIDATLRVHARIRAEGYANVGVVLQAMLRRTLDDARALVRAGIADVRVVKGIYLEPYAIAYQDPELVRRSVRARLRGGAGGRGPGGGGDARRAPRRRRARARGAPRPAGRAARVPGAARRGAAAARPARGRGRDGPRVRAVRGGGHGLRPPSAGGEPATRAPRGGRLARRPRVPGAGDRGPGGPRRAAGGARLSGGAAAGGRYRGGPWPRRRRSTRRRSPRASTPSSPGARPTCRSASARSTCTGCTRTSASTCRSSSRRSCGATSCPASACSTRSPGSGTTLVECSTFGCHSVGVDVSAFNVLLARTKVRERDAEATSADLLAALRRFEAGEGDADGVVDPYLEDWFAPRALASCCASARSSPTTRSRPTCCRSCSAAPRARRGSRRTSTSTSRAARSASRTRAASTAAPASPRTRPRSSCAATPSTPPGASRPTRRCAAGWRPSCTTATRARSTTPTTSTASSPRRRTPGASTTTGSIATPSRCSGCRRGWTRRSAHRRAGSRAAAIGTYVDDVAAVLANARRRLRPGAPVVIVIDDSRRPLRRGAGAGRPGAPAPPAAARQPPHGPALRPVLRADPHRARVSARPAPGVV